MLFRPSFSTIPGDARPSAEGVSVKRQMKMINAVFMTRIRDLETLLRLLTCCSFVSIRMRAVLNIDYPR